MHNPKLPNMRSVLLLTVGDLSSATGEGISAILEMKTTLKNEDSEFIGVRAIEGVGLPESSR